MRDLCCFRNDVIGVVCYVTKKDLVFVLFACWQESCSVVYDISLWQEKDEKFFVLFGSLIRTNALFLYSFCF